jgi:protein-L-isoaspartate(D-aspartate) O-methyltransferase
MNDTEIAKFNMIEQQIRPWEVLDHQVLDVIERLNREDFVDPSYRGLAYADCQIPLQNGVRMLPPTVEGRMLQALLLSPEDRVLEVGSGSGYITACLASLAARVRSIDADAEISARAQGNVARLGLNNVEFAQATLAEFDEPDSYDAIAVTASLPAIPKNLEQALKIGGRLFVICGESPVMEAMLITRVGASEWTRQSLFETDLPRLRQA